jgi:hypothetical protein
LGREILSSPESNEVNVFLRRLRPVQADEREPHPCTSRKAGQLRKFLKRHAGFFAEITSLCVRH